MPQQLSPTTAVAPADLESQLDQLMAQINQQAPETRAAMANGTAPPPSANTAATLPLGAKAVASAAVPAASTAIADSVAGATDGHTSAAAPDLVGQALASQIQELLDDAASAQKTEASASSAAAPATNALSAGNGAHSATPAPHRAEATLPDTQSQIAAAGSLPVDAVDREVLQQIDDHLAQEADNAVAGDFETVHEVLAQEQNPQAAPAAGNSAAVPSASAPVGNIAPAAHEMSQPTRAPMNSAGATAADVARELDEQPETTHASRGAVLAPIPAGREDRKSETPDTQPSAARRSPLTIRATLGAASGATRRLLAVLNRPLGNMAPGNRALVGYVGLVTLLVAFAPLGYAFFRAWQAHK